MNLLTLKAIKRGVIFFWAAWLSVVVATNIFNALKVLGVLPASFVFSSGNWEWIQQTMNPLGIPTAIQAVAFAGVIVWEALAAILYWRAFATYRGRPLVKEPALIAASAVNLALWAAFQVLDEVVLAFQPESVHRVLFANQLITLAVLYLLPADET